jgi:hypothetical protein
MFDDDARHALGHGIALVHKTSVHVFLLLYPDNTDRLLITRICTSESYYFILVGYHHRWNFALLFQQKNKLVKDFFKPLPLDFRKKILDFIVFVIFNHTESLKITRSVILIN